MPGGKVVAVRPPLPATLPTVTAVGTPVFLIQRLTYEFKPSVALPGRTALWRTITATGQADELVAVMVRHSAVRPGRDRKSTRLNSSHRCISYAVFCLKKKNKNAII